MKHFTIIELGADSESPMIGTILNVHVQSIDIKNRVLTAVEEHFDAEVISMELPDIFDSQAYFDIEVEIDDSIDYFKHTIRIMETWVY